MAELSNLTAIIEGGLIPRGEVRVSGAKNSATRLLAASLIAAGPVRLSNFPTELVDARHKIGFIEASGGRVDVDEEAEAVTVDADAAGRTYNIAFGERTTLNELHAALKNGLNVLTPSLTIDAPQYADFRPGDVRHSLADTGSATELLGYDPAYSGSGTGCRRRWGGIHRLRRRGSSDRG